MEKTKVMIVEDQELQRKMLEEILTGSGRYEVVASIDNADLADLYVETKEVELVLMDIYTAFGADGLEASERIKEEYPETKIMIRTSMPESAWVTRARAAGVESFCYKDVGEAAVLDACDRTMRGESVYPEG
ncbi:MAG: response regulator transcription factor [Lachnospiraceae bacterium]|nr:response regulator transcription factor [Lachnospiraceae bacterium]